MPAPASPTLVRPYLKSQSRSTLVRTLRFRSARRDPDATLAAICDRATRRTVRVLDRNDSHRSWIRASAFRSMLGNDKSNGRTTVPGDAPARTCNELKRFAPKSPAINRLRLSDYYCARRAGTNHLIGPVSYVKKRTRSYITRSPED